MFRLNYSVILFDSEFFDNSQLVVLHFFFLLDFLVLHLLNVSLNLIGLVCKVDTLIVVIKRLLLRRFLMVEFETLCFTLSQK